MGWLLWLVLVSPVTYSGSDVDRALSLIEHKAEIVRDHPDEAPEEAHSAERLANSMAPVLDPGVIFAVRKMANTARRQNSPQEARWRADEVIERVRAYRAWLQRRE
jgi:hypothetical protein